MNKILDRCGVLGLVASVSLWLAQCSPGTVGGCTSDADCAGESGQSCDFTDHKCKPTTCVPKSCQDLGKQCGNWNDGCGGRDCGTCMQPASCNNNTGKCESGCVPDCQGEYLCNGSECVLLDSIAVSPPTATIPVGGNQLFAGRGKDGSGNNVNAPIAWSSWETAVASVDSSGLATGLSPGTATIAAASGGVSGIATLTVSVADASHYFQDANDRPVYLVGYYQLWLGLAEYESINLQIIDRLSDNKVNYIRILPRIFQFNGSQWDLTTMTGCSISSSKRTPLSEPVQRRRFIDH